MSSTLLLGGARSGKSSHALALGERAATGEARVFVATAVASDDEMSDRIARHKTDRDAGWRTVEEPLDVADAIGTHCQIGRVVVVDCLTLWLNNLMLHERDVASEIGALTDAVRGVSGELVVVSNELGLGLVPDTPLGREYRDWHGVMNTRVAAVCDSVVLMVAGLPLALK